MTDASPSAHLDPAPPDPERWASLPDDLFDRVVPHVRRALADLDDDHLDAEVRRLRAVPPTKLRRGRGRRRLLAALARGGPFWVALRARLETDPELLATLATALVEGDGQPDTTEPAGDAGSDAALARLEERVARLAAARDEHKAQRDRAREERDEARRALDGAAGREESLRAELAAAEQELAARDRHVADLRRRVEEADAAVEKAVDRERRRRAGEVESLQAQLATARRELDELRRDAARQRRARAAPTTRAAQAPAPGRSGGDDDGEGLRPGRPTRLPRGMRPDTREGAQLLLAPGRRILVDGYNVTRTHQPGLDLRGQRGWLVDRLGGLAAARGVDPVVWFDAHEGGQPSTSRRRRGVQVRFTHPGTTADDEIVLEVDATEDDVPLVVVTDDRELRQRLARFHVDLLHTGVLVGLLP